MRTLLCVVITVLLFSANVTAKPWLDSDLDGVPDKKDACVNTPSLEPVDASGCSVNQINAQQMQRLNIMPQLCFTTSIGQLYPSACAEDSAIAVRFEFAKAQVLMSQQQVFQVVSRWLKSTKVPLVLVGHTDSIGTPGFNQQLSLARAEQVKHILVQQFGIAANRFQVKGMGSRLPVANNQTEYGRELNRRVEFIVKAQ